MIHHLSLGTNDLLRAKTFYDAVFATLDLKLMKQTPNELIYGAGTFLVSLIVPIDGHPATVGNGSHVAFAAEDRQMVIRFHQAAMSHGGSSDGEPGLRPDYDANYFGAFVRDPDGNKLEAVTHSSK